MNLWAAPSKCVISPQGNTVGANELIISAVFMPLNVNKTLCGGSSGHSLSVFNSPLTAAIAHDHQLESLCFLNAPPPKKNKCALCHSLLLHTEALLSEPCIIQNTPLKSRPLFHLPAPIMRHAWPSLRLCFSHLNVDSCCCLLASTLFSYAKGSFKFIIFSSSPIVIPPHGFTG